MTHAAELHDEILNIIAIDSGSGSIKIGVAHVNTNTHEVHDVIYNSLAIQLAKDLENHILMQEITATGEIQDLYDINNKPLNLCGFFNAELDQGNIFLNTLSPKSSKEAYDSLEHTYANKFSEAIKDIYINQIAETVKLALKLDPKHKTEVWLVGTAALRKADDGHYLIDALSHKINNELHIPTNFKIISQNDEGIYAFEGGVAILKADPTKTISWDIGGGSMQITGKEGNDYKVLGSTVASSTFKTMVEEQLTKEGKKSPGGSIYPFDSQEADALIKLAKDQLDFTTDQEKWLAAKKSTNNMTIIGVGNVHEALYNLMKIHLNKHEPVYSKEDVQKLIHLISNKLVEEVRKMIPKKGHPFLENYIVNMLLVIATMEKYYIDTVRVVPVSNVNTLLAKAATSKLKS